MVQAVEHRREHFILESVLRMESCSELPVEGIGPIETLSGKLWIFNAGSSGLIAWWEGGIKGRGGHRFIFNLPQSSSFRVCAGMVASSKLSDVKKFGYIVGEEGRKRGP